MKHRVTIGLCVKNNEKTIKFTIKSILNIDYPRDSLDLIVVDGGSRDKTLEIIREFLEASKNLEYQILSDEGRGLAYARQLVVDNTNSDFIQWVDGDHVIPRNFLKRQIKFITSSDKLGAVEAITRHIGNNWIAKLEGYTWLYYGLKRSKISELESVGSAGTIYRVKAIRDAGGYDINIKGAGEDGDLSRRIRKKGWKLAMNPHAYYFHITRDNLPDLLKEYYWYGYGAHYVSMKHKGEVSPLRFAPPLPFISGLKNSIHIYRLTHDPVSLLLPVHYSLKRMVWIYGYLKAHMDKYGF